jgi:putative redox protein
LRAACDPRGWRGETAEITVELARVDDTTTTEGSVRHHRVLVDRPPEKQGDDRGAMGGELLLLSPGGCFMGNVNVIAVARAREVRSEDLRARVTGTLTEHPQRYAAVRLEVSGGGVDAASFAKIVAISERACIVANTLRECRDLKIEVVEPAKAT